MEKREKKRKKRKGRLCMGDAYTQSSLLNIKQLSEAQIYSRSIYPSHFLRFVTISQTIEIFLTVASTS
jgi:hypothetical protein